MRRHLRFTGVAAVATLWTTLLSATMVAGFDLFGDRPLSYLGTRSTAAGLFTAGLAVSAVLLAGFHSYVRDRYPTTRGFSVAMLTGLTGQMIAAFVPIEGDPTAHGVHTTAALVLGASLPLLMWRFAAAQESGRWRRLSYGLFWAEAAACVVGLYLSASHVAPVAEILPAVVFHAWIFTLTFPPAGAATAMTDEFPTVARSEGHDNAKPGSGGPEPLRWRVAHGPSLPGPARARRGGHRPV